MERKVNPNCTDFCTGNGQSKGHPEVTQAEMRSMAETLARHFIPYVGGVPEAYHMAAVQMLYREGFGYHAIADLLRISHERANRMLMGGV